MIKKTKPTKIKKEQVKKYIDTDVVASVINVDMKYLDKEGAVFILKQIAINRYGEILRYIGYYAENCGGLLGGWESLPYFGEYQGDLEFSEFKLYQPSNAEKFIKGTKD